MKMHAKNKLDLQREFLLPRDPNKPIMAYAGRLSRQKGLDLLLEALPHILTEDPHVQFILLGGGDDTYSQRFLSFQKDFPDRIGLHLLPNFRLPRKIFAGADIQFIPSVFEPGGIIALEALRYGAVPLVRRTGGLNDIVTEFDPKTRNGNGFSFYHKDPWGLYGTMIRALDPLSSACHVESGWSKTASRRIFPGPTRPKTTKAGTAKRRACINACSVKPTSHRIRPHSDMPDTLKDNLDWFEKWKAGPDFDDFQARPIAYFCAEYGLEARIPIYAGGLGILAGDVFREMGDRGIPFIAVGLYYRNGYLCDADVAKNACVTVLPEDVGLTPVVDAQGHRVTVTVPVDGKDIVVQGWQYTHKDAKLFLLETTNEQNDPHDRMITDQLYVGDKETRLKQEIILGIGGLRFLEALGYHPSIYHLNEGHSAMLVLELIHHEIKERKLGFEQVKQFARRRIVFTNHTLVPAGNEVYSNDLVALLLDRYAKILEVPISEIVKLGLVQESSTFSMTMLSLRMAGIINAVSKLHAKKAKEIWTDHPMFGITNGVSLPMWDKIGTSEDDPSALWKQHQSRKKELLAVIKEKTGAEWGMDDLLLGWARRFVHYKRPLALVSEVERLKELAQRSDRPVRIVYAGQPHPSDADGVAMLKQLKDLIAGELSGTVVYLPHYDIDTAQTLTSGCDIWVNTPVVGFEACGTSGMKAALNGALPLTTRDGWVDEIPLEDIGWELNTNRVTDDLLDQLENAIIPMYYTKNAEGLSEDWVKRMQAARTLIRDRFSATRMVREYIQMLYT